MGRETEALSVLIQLSSRQRSEVRGRAAHRSCSTLSSAAVEVITWLRQGTDVRSLAPGVLCLHGCGSGGLGAIRA